MQVAAQDTEYPSLGQLLKLSHVATEVSVNGIRPCRQPMRCRAGPIGPHRREQQRGVDSPKVPN
jgi:hypothetical protein